jgi:hypothetical protein
LDAVKAMPKSSDDKKRDEVLKRMLQTPHKPHVKKLLTKSVKKKGDGPTVQKNRRLQDS